MKNVNQRRKYSNIKKFNDCCATALHVASDRWIPSLAATVRTGAEKDFIKEDPKEKAQIKRNRKDRTIENMINYMNFISGEEQRSNVNRSGRTGLTVPEDHNGDG